MGAADRDAGLSPATNELVSTIIVNYESGSDLLRCVRSLAEQRVPMQIVVVDNGSRDGSADAAKRDLPDIELVRPHRNLGFAEGANLGARHANGAVLLFLNPDVILARDCVAILTKALSDDQVGVVGPAVKVLATDQIEYGATMDILGSPKGLTRAVPPLYVPGCVLATRSEVFNQLGEFDGRYFMFVEDLDYCWRALIAGWDVRVAKDAHAWHAGGASAPGGYPKPGRIDTTAFRVGLRERNTLATLLKCYSWIALPLVLPFYLLQSVATAVGLALAGDLRTAQRVLGVIAWNVRQLAVTLALRDRIQRNRRVGDLDLLRRIHRGLRKVELLARHGFPRLA